MTFGSDGTDIQDTADAVLPERVQKFVAVFIKARVIVVHMGVEYHVVIPL
jgi:hypothetical protein